MTEEERKEWLDWYFKEIFPGVMEATRDFK